jgi:PAS domain S-box-containing protein
MPTGAFQVEVKEGKEIISYCNKAFAEMFGYTPTEIIDRMDATEFHANPTATEKFERALNEKDKEGQPLLDYRLRSKKKSGELFTVELDTHLLKDKNGKIIGRQGTVRDATIQIQLQEIIRRKDDVQRFSHKFMAPIMSIRNTANVFISEVGQLMKFGLCGDEYVYGVEMKCNTYNIYKEIVCISKDILNALNELIEVKKGDRKIIQKLILFKSKLERYTRKAKLEKIIELREVNRNIENYLKFVSDKISNKESSIIVDKVYVSLRRINYFYLLYLSQIITDTSKMALADVENLRSLLLRWDNVRKEEAYEFSLRNIYDCIEEVVDIYRMEAMSKGIRFQISESRNFVRLLEISKDNILILFHNLIHNAVKYSFKRKHAFISIKLNYLPEEKSDEIIIENYGVGVLNKENEKVFEYGYRGELSHDMNRTGSGIGLPEAKEIVKKHGGNITIYSEPMAEDGRSVDQNTPHLTKVRITLPIHHYKEVK